MFQNSTSSNPRLLKWLRQRILDHYLRRGRTRRRGKQKIKYFQYITRIIYWSLRKLGIFWRSVSTANTLVNQQYYRIPLINDMPDQSNVRTKSFSSHLGLMLNNGWKLYDMIEMMENMLIISHWLSIILCDGQCQHVSFSVRIPDTFVQSRAKNWKHNYHYVSFTWVHFHFSNSSYGNLSPIAIFSGNFNYPFIGTSQNKSSCRS